MEGHPTLVQWLVVVCGLIGAAGGYRVAVAASAAGWIRPGARAIVVTLAGTGLMFALLAGTLEVLSRLLQ